MRTTSRDRLIPTRARPPQRSLAWRLVLLVLPCLGFGCAHLSTDLRALSVEPAAGSPVAASVGLRGFVDVHQPDTGVFLLTNQPTVASALRNKGRASADLQQLLYDVVSKSAIFETVAIPPYSSNDVDFELVGRLDALDYHDNYASWWVMGLLTLGITDLIGIPYTSTAEAVISLEIHDTAENLLATARGNGLGKKKTNFYQLMFMLAEVPHAMEAVNRALTDAVRDAAIELAREGPRLEGIAAAQRTRIAKERTVAPRQSLSEIARPLPAAKRPPVESDESKTRTAAVLLPLTYDGGFGVNFPVAIGIDGNEQQMLKPGAQVIEKLSLGTHIVRIVDPKQGFLHKPDWDDYELVLDLAALAQPSVVLEGRNRGFKFSLEACVLSNGREVDRYEIELR